MGLEPVHKWIFLQTSLAAFQAEMGARAKTVELGRTGKGFFYSTAPGLLGEAGKKERREGGERTKEEVEAYTERNHVTKKNCKSEQRVCPSAEE